MSFWTHDQKAEFCRQFLASGESQEGFCESYRRKTGWGPSARSLREWLRIYTSPVAFRAEARAVVAHTVEELGALLRAFDTLDDVRGRVAPQPTVRDLERASSACGTPDPEPAACQDGSDSEAAGANCQVPDDALVRPPESASSDGRQLAGSESEPEPRDADANGESGVSLLDEHETAQHVAAVAHELTVNLPRSDSPRKRKRSFFDVLEEPTPAAEAEAARLLDEVVTKVQRILSAKDAATGARNRTEAESVRPLALPTKNGGFMSY